MTAVILDTCALIWLGFVGGVIGGAVASTIIDRSQTVVVQQA